MLFIYKMNSQFVDEFEMLEIQNDQDLNRRLKRAPNDVKEQRRHTIRDIYK